MEKDPVSLTIVGKSVTFDSGGLDIKPADGMRHMKRDMSGGAVTLAAIQAIAAMGLPIKVRCVMAATENMINGKAYKPGDVIHTMNGLSVEVDNTDAEGRLTLADAIEYAKRLGDSTIVDLATLTGAVKMVTGDVGACVFSNNDEFSSLVVSSAASQGERLLNIPMWEEFRDSNKSDMADLKNSGGAPGSTTAAYFLRSFAGEEIRWAHLDIAGVAFRDRELGADPRGSTGFGVRTLVELATRLAAK
jgi:leucyl aminopeptidase